MITLNLNWIRGQFSALNQTMQGQPVIFLDGPGGTQVPDTVIEAMVSYLTTSNANSHGAFLTSNRTDEVILEAHRAIADLLGCDADEVVVGANMTSLTFMLSRSIGRTLQPGDEIILTTLDHAANVAPWQALEDQGAIIRCVDIHPEDCTLNLAQFEQLLNPRTRLVAVGYASNAVGTINDVATIIQMAHQVGAMVFVDAVHYAPHGLIDVRTLGCDFLACSAYKFFGPHMGALYGKREHLARLEPYKVRPASNEVPWRWETGTQNHEGLAGAIAAINYLATLGRQVNPTASDRRAALIAGMTAIQTYEQTLSQHLIPKLLDIPGLTLYGIADLDQVQWRTPTVGIRLSGKSPHEVSKALGDRGIFTWDGNFYALSLTERLGLEDSGGLVRIGLVHYNTVDEMHQLLNSLHTIASM